MGAATQFGEGGAMTTWLEEKIARVARERGISFPEAARVVGLRAAMSRARRREVVRGRVLAQVEGMRKSWYWRRDFE